MTDQLSKIHKIGIVHFRDSWNIPYTCTSMSIAGYFKEQRPTF